VRAGRVRVLLLASHLLGASLPGGWAPEAPLPYLRSMAATAMVAAGVDIKPAQTRLGHANPTLTLQIYARASSEADRQTDEKVGERLRPRDDWSVGGEKPSSPNGVRTRAATLRGLHRGRDPLPAPLPHPAPWRGGAVELAGAPSPGEPQGHRSPTSVASNRDHLASSHPGSPSRSGPAVGRVPILGVGHAFNSRGVSVGDHGGEP
jgi:hypothetical protein